MTINAVSKSEARKYALNLLNAVRWMFHRQANVVEHRECFKTAAVMTNGRQQGLADLPKSLLLQFSIHGTRQSGQIITVLAKAVLDSGNLFEPLRPIVLYKLVLNIAFLSSTSPSASPTPDLLSTGNHWDLSRCE